MSEQSHPQNPQTLGATATTEPSIDSPDLVSVKQWRPAQAPIHPQPWEIRIAQGPVIACAIHAGHDVSPAAADWMSASATERLREEDPMTDFGLTLGDTSIRVNRSRFEFDLNRPRRLAVATDPEATWGLQVWRAPPPQRIVNAALELHRSFYQTVGALMDRLIERWGSVLVLDLHSYNHRRRSPLEAADSASNPDIDLGTTTLDRHRFGRLVDGFTRCLRESGGGPDRPLDVRENVKYAGGGHFPEWLHRRQPSRACVISLEYKKFFMDEWRATADLHALDALRIGLANAIDTARTELTRCS